LALDRSANGDEQSTRLSATRSGDFAVENLDRHHLVKIE
jgi:hypothetical protein